RRDAVKPGGETGIATEAGAMTVGVEEGVLSDVGGFVFVLEIFHGDRIDILTLAAFEAHLIWSGLGPGLTSLGGLGGRGCCLHASFPEQRLSHHDSPIVPCT